MSLYTQTFTLTDIFNNKRLRGKLPLINYKEIEKENGKVSRRTNTKTITREVFDTATSSAKPFYKPILTHRSGNIMVIEGNLVGDHDACVDAVYNSLVAKKSLLSLIANDREILRSAVKEAEKTKRNYGIDSKLYLKVRSMQQIEGMTDRQLEKLMNDIMENIFYGDDFPETQKKFGVDKQYVSGKFNYEQRQKLWKIKVGE